MFTQHHKLKMQFGHSFIQQRQFGRLSVKSTKRKFVKTAMHICCVKSIGIHRHSDNYWPGMNNTAFLVVFVDPFERGLF